MAKLRSVSTSFWSDPFIEDLTPSEKLVYLYLITNDKTNMLGIFEVSVRKISFETGVDKTMVEKALKAFEKVGKVKTNGNYIILVNYLKHQNFNTNMKKSAIDTYNNLPQLLKDKSVTVSKSNPLKGFETLLNHYGMVSKLEVEVEKELELEIEDKPKKLLMCEVDTSHDTGEYFQIAYSYFQLFKKNANTLGVTWSHLDKAKVFDYQRDVRLIIEVDKRTVDDLRDVWNFLSKDEFWIQNIQSTKKLREKFDQLITKAKNPIKNGKKESTINKLAEWGAENDPNWDTY